MSELLNCKLPHGSTAGFEHCSRYVIFITLLGIGIVGAGYKVLSLFLVLCPTGLAVARQMTCPCPRDIQALWGLAAAWVVNRERGQRP